MKPTVLLFDVDGTLVTTGGVGRRAIERTFAQRFSRPDACTSFRLDGMTDRAIFRRALEAIGEEPDDRLMDALLREYLQVLREEVTQADPCRYRAHEGVTATLDAACGLRAVAVGLGTGNVREGARLKLERLGLFDRFSFGGFGCDHEDRTELLRAGAKRGAERLGVAQDECRVVAIGDTPKDVAAAHGIGAECLGVGTGSFRPAQLLECGAEAAVSDLSQEEALTFLFWSAAA